MENICNHHSSRLFFGLNRTSKYTTCVQVLRVPERWYCPSQMGLRGTDGSRQSLEQRHVRGLGLSHAGAEDCRLEKGSGDRGCLRMG
jgi:hypothetical protein